MAENDGPMDEIGETLGKKVGPLPLGAWLLAVLGGLGVAWMIRRSNGGTPAPTGETEDGYAIGGTNPGAGNLIGPDPAEKDAGGDGPAGPITTNDEWYSRASSALLASLMGYSPTAITTALTKYLSGYALTSGEDTIISAAIRAVGAPPVPPPLPQEPIAPDPIVQPDPVEPHYPQPGNSAPQPQQPQQPQQPKPLTAKEAAAQVAKVKASIVAAQQKAAAEAKQKAAAEAKKRAEATAQLAKVKAAAVAAQKAEAKKRAAAEAKKKAEATAKLAKVKASITKGW